MKTAISYRKVSTLSHPEWESVVGKLVGRHLERHLSHFPAELIRLRVILERSGHPQTLPRAAPPRAAKSLSLALRKALLVMREDELLAVITPDQAQ
jgi:hypothetical protein